MMWEIAKLGDITKNIQTGPFGSQLHNRIIRNVEYQL